MIRKTMTNTMTYKGYIARIDYDDNDRLFTGRIACIRDIVGFHADTVEGLREAFHEAVENYPVIPRAKTRATYGCFQT